MVPVLCAKLLNSVLSKFTSMISDLDKAIGLMLDEAATNDTKIADLVARNDELDEQVKKAESVKGKIKGLVG